jgi:hypothetical protein
MTAAMKTRLIPLSAHYKALTMRAWIQARGRQA